jgi:hypothetical protein
MENAIIASFTDVGVPLVLAVGSGGFNLPSFGIPETLGFAGKTAVGIGSCHDVPLVLQL